MPLGLTEFALGASLLPTVFGTGASVKVPGSIAKPEDPRKTILDDNGYVQNQFRLENYIDPTQKTAEGILNQQLNTANSTGPTQAAQSLLDVNTAETGILKDKLAADSASGLATAEANLAMKGGMGTGSRERLHSNNAINTINQKANINQQGSLNKLNTLASDNQYKQGLLNGLSGQFMDMAKFNTGKKQADINNSIGTSTDLFNSEMSAYAGNQLGRAQAQQFNASQKGILGGLF